MNVYQLLGAENLGWFTKDEVYKVSNNLHAAVYSLAFCRTKPSNHLYPHEVKEVFYVGQSGNEKNKHLHYDQKVRKNMGHYMAPKSGATVTTLKRRLKSHSQNLEKESENSDTMYKLFREKYTPLLRKDYQVFYNLLVPSATVRPDATKAWLTMIEPMVIYSYSDKWKEEPHCNTANKSLSRRQEDSLSTLMIESNYQSSLEVFMHD